MPSEIRLIRRSGDINELAKRHRAKVSAALAETVEVAASVARQLAPVRTGFLRDSIFTSQENDLKFTVGASAPYASFVELGTAFQSAQPFIGPAVQLARRHLRDLLTHG